MANLNSQYVELKIDDGTSMLAWVSRPAAEEPKRGMLVFQEAFGVNTNIRDVADRFAALGYAAIAPELFHRTVPPKWEGSYTDLPAAMPHLQALTETGLEHDVRAAYNWRKCRMYRLLHGRPRGVSCQLGPSVEGCCFLLRREYAGAAWTDAQTVRANAAILG